MKRTLRSRRGQAMSEYLLITFALFGVAALSWPYLTQVMNALNVYVQGIYYVLQSPIL